MYSETASISRTIALARIQEMESKRFACSMGIGLNNSSALLNLSLCLKQVSWSAVLCTTCAAVHTTLYNIQYYQNVSKMGLILKMPFIIWFMIIIKWRSTHNE